MSERRFLTTTDKETFDNQISSLSEEKQYELIEAYTLEANSTFMRDIEPDGTPYNFKKFKYMVVSPETNVDSSYINGLVYSDTGVRIIVNQNVAKSATSYSFVELWRENDVWDAQYNYTAGIDAYAFIQKPAKLMHDTLRVPSAFGNSVVKLYINVPLAAGTIIKIWGVRADA